MRRMGKELTEEEENEYIRGETAEGLIIIYQAHGTDPKLKQKIRDNLFERLTRLEPLEQAIINRRLHYERWLNERGYFGKWDNIRDLTKGRDDAYQFGIASGIYDVCDALLKMMEKKEDDKEED